jgi:ABC-type iron transport system FetAB ATPase subunit
MALVVTGLQVPGLPPLDFRIEPSSVLALGGPSGVGKTLLLRALQDLDPHQGQVCLGDRCAADMPGPQWRRLVGYLPAETHWWAETAADHWPDAEEGRVAMLLEALGLSTDALGWQLSRMSSGERQRLSLVRLLLASPSVLLLDEPTANLDMDNTARVESLVHRVADEGAIVMWVSHSKDQCRRVADQYLSLTPEGLQEAEP